LKLDDQLITIDDVSILLFVFTPRALEGNRHTPSTNITESILPCLSQCSQSGVAQYIWQSFFFETHQIRGNSQCQRGREEYHQVRPRLFFLVKVFSTNQFFLLHRKVKLTLLEGFEDVAAFFEFLSAIPNLRSLEYM